MGTSPSSLMAVSGLSCSATLKGIPINRAEDQPGAGGGCVYSFDLETRTILSGWRRIED